MLHRERTLIPILKVVLNLIILRRETLQFCKKFPWNQWSYLEILNHSFRVSVTSFQFSEFGVSTNVTIIMRRENQIGIFRMWPSVLPSQLPPMVDFRQTAKIKSSNFWNMVILFSYLFTILPFIIFNVSLYHNLSWRSHFMLLFQRCHG